LAFSCYRHRLSSTASFWSSHVLFFIVFLLIPISPTLPVTCLRGIRRNEQMDALTAAVTCLGLSGDPKSYLRSISDRKLHSQEINRKIRQIIPPRLRRFYWLRSCGPWLEDT
jgi:hypothetical protein